CGCRAEHGRSDTVVHRSALDELLLDAVGASGAVAGPLRTAAPGLRDWGPPELRRAARTLGDRLGPDDPRLARLHHLESQAFTAETSALDEAFEEQFAVDTGLLGSGSADPRSLAWLTRTHVTSAVLALWRPAGSAELSTVGVHDPAGGLQHLLGTTAGVRSFPPSALVERASAGSAEVCVVVPVRSPDRDWGLLALVWRVDTASARETYHHWGTLLAASLERMALQDAVATSERRYATAARATNEGLWEWDLDRDSLYLSGRGRALIGLDGDDLDLAAVLRQVHAGDREAVRSALAEVRVRVGRPTEVEFRVGEDSPRWLLFRGLGVSDDGAEVARVVGSVADIGPRKQLEERLRQAAMYDPVTGLANRRLFTDRLADAIRRHERDPSRGYAVVFLDLDGFKLVNDSLGHPAGDVLLRAVADRLSSGLRAGDTAARFGGDEFAVLLADPEPEDLLLVAERLAARVAAPVELGAERVSVTASIGITTSGERVRDTAQVMRDADIAMYHAKESAPGTAALFDRAMHDRAERRLHLHTELNAALEHSQFAVHYQPIVSLDGSPVTRFEALLRWHHPERGLLPPAEFLQALTDGPLIVTLGEWVLDRVCAQIAQWRAERGVVATVSGNLSHREFWSPGLVRAVSDALACHGVGAESLALEITETVVMTDVPAARERMRALRDLGVRLHVDDFGTGTSSLHALRSFPVDALKIDGAFVRDLPGNDQTAKLVAVIVEMGRALGVRVIAECVENDLQADFLRSHGCPDAQGWLFGHAMPGDAAGALLGRVPD
ncbi:MAG TPA: EAL domain-containing protein, partial [Actinotalea sp.]|nr:EAL domain-containing protein [Actinotalea sp.]